MDKRFNKMIGRTYMWSSQSHSIKALDALADDMFLVTSQLGEYRVSKEELEKDFLPVLNEVVTVDNKLMEVFQLESVQLNEVSGILMNTILKLQTDPGFVGQAKAISEAANTLIDIKKTQIELLRTLKS